MTQAELDGLAHRIGDVYVCWTPTTGGWWRHWVDEVVSMNMACMISARFGSQVPLSSEVVTVWR